VEAITLECNVLQKSNVELVNIFVISI